MQAVGCFQVSLWGAHRVTCSIHFWRFIHALTKMRLKSKGMNAPAWCCWPWKRLYIMRNATSVFMKSCWIYAIGKHCQSPEMDILVHKITFLSLSFCLFYPESLSSFFFHAGTYSALRLMWGEKQWRLHYNDNKHTHNFGMAIPSQIPSVAHSGQGSRKKDYISMGWMELTGGGNSVSDICHQWPAGLWGRMALLHSLKEAVDAFCQCDGFKGQG